MAEVMRAHDARISARVLCTLVCAPRGRSCLLKMPRSVDAFVAEHYNPDNTHTHTHTHKNTAGENASRMGCIMEENDAHTHRRRFVGRHVKKGEVNAVFQLDRVRFAYTRKFAGA